MRQHGASQFLDNIDLDNNRVTNVQNPVNPQDVVTLDFLNNNPPGQTATNGLQVLAGGVALGGTMTESNTVITVDQLNFLRFVNDGTALGLGESSIGVGFGGITIESRSVDSISYGSFAVSDVTANIEFFNGTAFKTIAVSSAGLLITDSLDNKGLEYVADYSDNFTDESLITKRYADSLSGFSVIDVSTSTHSADVGQFILTSFSTGIATITMPLAASNSGRTIVVKKNNSSSFSTIVSAQVGEKLVEDLEYDTIEITNQGTSVTFASNGVNRHVI